MGVWADERAQSIQIGAILLFGILILAFVGYQATVVPNQNAGVEAGHSQDVQADMVDVRNTILGTAATGDARPASVDLGPTYPARAMFINPGPAAGTLETVELSDSGSNEIRITHAEALDEEADDYWTGDPSVPRSYQTRGIQYVPQYNVYQNAPTTVYENSVLYNRFRRAAVSDDASTVDDNVAATNSGQSLVNGRTITLVAVQGDRDTASTESVSVDASVVSGPMKTVAVTDSGSNVTVEVPTRLSTDTWKRLLADQTAPDGFVVENSIEVTNGVLTFELVQGETYNLKLGGVSVGDGSIPTSTAYVTETDGGGGSMEDTGTRELVVQVRDEYNNPVTGARVEVLAGPSHGTISPTGPVSTDEEGFARFTYEPNDLSTTETEELTIGLVSGDDSANHPENAEFRFDVTNAAGSGGGDGEGPQVAPFTAPSSINEGDKIIIDGTASDVGHGGTDIIAIEWFRAEPGQSEEGADPGNGNGDAIPEIALVDDNFDQPREEFETSSPNRIDTSGWPAGDNTLYVRAQDGNGNWGPTSAEVVAVQSGGTNSPPTADFGHTPSDPEAGEQIDFTDQSSDPDGDSLSHSWDFGDGDTSSVRNPSHTYSSPGTYTVELSVSDGNGGTDTTTETISVSSGDNPPTASINDVSDYSYCSNLNPGGNCPGNSFEYVWYVISWATTDDAGIQSVELQLVDNDGNVVDSENPPASGTSQSGTVWLTDNAGYGDEYSIELVVTDTATPPQQDSDQVTDTADGDDP